MNSQNEVESDFYYNGPDEKVELVRDPSLYAVRFRRGRRDDSPDLSSEARTLLREESAPVDFVPNHGLHVYQFRDAATDRDAADGGNVAPRRDAWTQKATLRSSRLVGDLNLEDPVAFATPVFRHTADSPHPIYLTNRFIVEFKPGVDQARVAEINGFHDVRIIERFAFAGPDRLCYLLEAPSGEGERGSVELAKVYFELGVAEYAIPDFVRRRFMRMAPRESSRRSDSPRGEKTERSKKSERSKKDERGERSRSSGRVERTGGSAGATWPYRDAQWHLPAVSVPEAWEITRGAEQVVIGISDDGIDLSHPEFAGRTAGQFDFAANVSDARPKLASDNHGTAVAGVALAGGVQASGAAPGCRLLAVRSPDMLGVSDEARMFEWMADQGADVISCSWGPEDGRNLTVPLPGSTRSAIRYCVTRARNGKGIPIFWAAGNGAESVNTDGYASNPDVIAVAASTRNNTIAYYSDFGPSIWICAPSSGRASAGESRIFTTDRREAAGYNSGGSAQGGDELGDYTSTFGGTSSSAPLAAGVAGLMLSANPELTVDQVRTILAETADKIGSGYDGDGHSEVYGYGKINALRAVQVAAEAAGGGGAGTGAGPSRPTITASASCMPRSGISPSFRIDSRSQPTWAVEVTTEARLFDRANHGGRRNAENFYASWQDVGLLSGTSYVLPDHAWDRLARGSPAVERLYYRVWSSGSLSDWVNPQTSTPNADYSDSPSIEMKGNAQGATPAILGPRAVSRSGPPPSFEIRPGDQPYFAVEVATEASLFDRANHGGRRNAENFYASWQSVGLLSGTSYVLPNDVWDRLVGTDAPPAALYYRVWTSAIESAWSNPTPSLANEDFECASAIRITDVAGKRTTRRGVSTDEVSAVAPVETQPAIIDGPMQYDRNNPDPPTFLVVPGSRGQMFAVEVASDAGLFDEEQWLHRTMQTFFASWREEPLFGSEEPDGRTTYTLPPSVWDGLRRADQLYYRALVPSGEGKAFPVLRSTLAEDDGGAPLSISLGGRLGRRLPDVVYRPEEDLWRQEP